MSCSSICETPSPGSRHEESCGASALGRADIQRLSSATLANLPFPAEVGDQLVFFPLPCSGTHIALSSSPRSGPTAGPAFSVVGFPGLKGPLNVVGAILRHPALDVGLVIL